MEMESRMKKLQFDILNKIYENGPMATEQLCRELFREREQVESDCDALRKRCYLDENGVTRQGMDFLSNYKIDNAVILAAGLSSRFVPLSYEKPKGLLTVKGEVLIERQIRQLKERGIDEIIVVVGHMKEQFEYLRSAFGVILVETNEYLTRNNHSSIYAAKSYLKNTIITSSDLYFSQNIFQRYAYDSYYCTLYVSGKTAERGIETDDDDRITATFYGDRCCDIWITLGYAYFSSRFSQNMLEILEKEYAMPQTAGKFWADIQDEHLDVLYMYAKRVADHIIYEFDSVEELRLFDEKYQYQSGSKYLKQICYLLAAEEKDLVNIESLRKIKASLFKFECRGDAYICDICPDETEKRSYMGRTYYQCRDYNHKDIKLYRMDKNIGYSDELYVDIEQELKDLYVYSKDFIDYHQRALPLCAAENVISDFANLPLDMGFQERYIMNNTYSFNMGDNFIGCEKLLPFYQKLSDVCGRVFGAAYTDARPFSGMNCIDMVLKTVLKPGERLMILSAKHGGHASVRPVAERLGLTVLDAPYCVEKNDLDYGTLNRMLEEEHIRYLLLAPSDLIAVPELRRIHAADTVVLYDCSQVMGLIAAGLADNPLKYMDNLIMFGGTHKTFPGPASGLILTNNQQLHQRMETQINPKYLRHSQMHQKISLLFALIEFEKYGREYMRHMLHCSNYLGERLKALGYDVARVNGKVSDTHQIFIRCTEEEMNTIYDNAYQCEVTLNKKHKELFHGYGIRLGTQELARYDWNDAALDLVAEIMVQLRKSDIQILAVKERIAQLPEKKIHFTFDADVCRKMASLTDR